MNKIKAFIMGMALVFMMVAASGCAELISTAIGAGISYGIYQLSK